MSIDFDYKRFFDISPDLVCIAGYDEYFKKEWRIRLAGMDITTG